MPLGSVANERLRHMRVGDARVSKADGSQSLDLQRDALQVAGVDAGNVYHDVASGVTRRPPGTRQLRAHAIVLPGRTTRPVSFAEPMVPARGRRSRR